LKCIARPSNGVRTSGASALRVMWCIGERAHASVCFTWHGAHAAEPT
jgi:hypothetical protein